MALMGFDGFSMSGFFFFFIFSFSLPSNLHPRLLAIVDGSLSSF